MSIKQRVEEFIKYKKISMRKFESSCGLSNGYFSSLKNAIGNDKMKIITLQYPDLNPVWLQMGEGEMLKSDAESDIENIVMNPHFECQTIDALSKALNRMTEMYQKVVLENEELRDELENLRGVVSAQKAGA